MGRLLVRAIYRPPVTSIGLMAFAALVALRADASSIAIVPQVILRARPPSPLPPGSPGTLAHAIEAQRKRRYFWRAENEGTMPDRNPDGKCPPEMANVDGRFC